MILRRADRIVDHPDVKLSIKNMAIILLALGIVGLFHVQHQYRLWMEWIVRGRKKPW
jgi:hypothetical protein